MTRQYNISNGAMGRYDTVEEAEGRLRRLAQMWGDYEVTEAMADTLATPIDMSWTTEGRIVEAPAIRERDLAGFAI